MGSTLMTDRIEAMLPQTHCSRCGFDGCRPYAEAISAGQADINRCPPGGETTIDALASLLGVEPQPLDAECGHLLPRRIAKVEEQWCLGCARCLAACPVDAILGAPGQMHTVIAEECTGCERCVVPCPVDCIQMMSYCGSPNLSSGLNLAEAVSLGDHEISVWPGGWNRRQADRARRRYLARQLRLTTKRVKWARDQEHKKKVAALHRQRGELRHHAIEAILARVHARRGST